MRSDGHGVSNLLTKATACGLNFHGGVTCCSRLKRARNLINAGKPINVFHVALPEAGGCMPIVENMRVSIESSDPAANVFLGLELNTYTTHCPQVYTCAIVFICQ